MRKQIHRCLAIRVQAARTIFPTQALRGQAWYNDVQYLLTTPGYNGTYPLVGFDWWSWQDFQNLNQGLVSIHDNAYDGHEDVIGKVSLLPSSSSVHLRRRSGQLRRRDRKGETGQRALVLIVALKGKHLESISAQRRLAR